MPKPNPSESFEQQLERLTGLGFAVQSTEANCWKVTKGNCAAVLQRGPEGGRIHERPGYLLGGETHHLVDGGYQKFLAGPSRKLPATAEHLREIHAFEEGLRHALGLTSLYNESLGTVSERYHYDRVKGRPNP